MNLLKANLIQPLYLAETDLLQVLLSQFTLTRQGAGVQLEVCFDERTPTIWSRKAKTYLRENMSDFSRKARKYQKKLDDFLVHNERSSYKFKDDKFYFRYSSGGTLPVIRMGKNEYYCLFYRDIHPIGWNIANGGCDTRRELLNPVETIERELREELVIIDPENKWRYVFETNEGERLDHPDFATAWRLWLPKFHELKFIDLEDKQVPLKWLKGPDTLKIRFGDVAPASITECCLNINAIDFGIEIDRVAKIEVGESAIFCDGEILKQQIQQKSDPTYQLMNRPVGLFEVEKFNRGLTNNAREFMPDHAFYGGERLASNAWLWTALTAAIFPTRATKEMREYKATADKFDLCPVTRRIIQRYLNLEGKERKRTRDHLRNDSARPYDIFVSFASEDRELAGRVYKYLCKKTGKPVFFSDETLNQSNFGREIDDALDSANCLVVVGSRLEHLMKGWVEYEWRSFHQDINSGRKPKDTKLIPFISNIDPNDLPGPLRINNAIVFTPKETEVKLRKLVSRIS